MQPRMLALLLVFLVAAAVCARLGVWQLERAYERGEQAARHAVAEQGAPVRPLGELLAPQETFRGELVGVRGAVTGRFEDGQLFVEQRVHDGRTGYLVLAPLRVSDDGTGGASWAGLSGPPVLPVVRGWVPEPGDYPLPTGEVDVTGYLQASEAVAAGIVGDGVTDSISSPLLVGQWGGPVYSGYLVLAGSEPTPDAAIALLDRPSLPDEGVNLQNLFYALQWWIFGLFAVGLWARMVLDEARGGAADGFEGWEALQPPAA
ncbi:SURF1-like protein [Flavimobilis marinus]|nr:SURF1-like protein [Flavimobilis marinus]